MKETFFNGVRGLHNTLLHPFCKKGVQNPASPLKSTRILHPFPDKEEKKGAPPKSARQARGPFPANRLTVIPRSRQRFRSPGSVSFSARAVAE
jgi:hypothetical protein